LGEPEPDRRGDHDSGVKAVLKRRGHGKS
jgi:hypothetical protein